MTKTFSADTAKLMNDALQYPFLNVHSSLATLQEDKIREIIKATVRPDQKPVKHRVVGENAGPIERNYLTDEHETLAALIVKHPGKRRGFYAAKMGIADDEVTRIGTSLRRRGVIEVRVTLNVGGRGKAGHYYPGKVTWADVAPKDTDDELTKSQRRCMDVIEEAPGMDRAFYADKLGMEKSSVSKLAVGLNKLGFIRIDRTFGRGGTRSTYHPVAT